MQESCKVARKIVLPGYDSVSEETQHGMVSVGL